jgi:hypothetical protein
MRFLKRKSFSWILAGVPFVYVWNILLENIFKLKTFFFFWKNGIFYRLFAALKMVKKKYFPTFVLYEKLPNISYIFI